MSYYIGVDIGTGSAKAVAIEENAKKVLLTQQVTYPILHPGPHLSEQDPERIWQAFVRCIAQTIDTLKSAPKAIGLSSAMHSVIPVDKTGQALMNMITWADGRSADIAEQIRKSTTAEAIYRVTGTPIHAMTPLCKIRWIRENRPEVFEKTAKFISIKEYIWYKLFQAYEVDHSIASGMGMFDTEKLVWHTPALSLAGIDEDYLSTPVSTSHLRNEISPAVVHELHCQANTNFVIGASDGCLANLGSQAITPGTASLTIGTSGAIRVASPTPCHHFKSMIFSYRLDEELFLCGGPINNGGAVWNWYVKDFLQKDLDDPKAHAELLQRAATLPPGANGLLLLPYLMGERAPIWNSKSSGVFFGIRDTHTQEHFTRAVIEGISMALYSVWKSLEAVCGNVECIYASGGFVRADLWLHVIADIFNKPVALQNAEDASAIGAALMAIKRVEGRKTYPVFETTEKPRIIFPDAGNHKRYQSVYALFTRVYEKLKEEMDLVYQLTEN